eukprot:730409-Prymnesium_polylepis.1
MDPIDVLTRIIVDLVRSDRLKITKPSLIKTTPRARRALQSPMRCAGAGANFAPRGGANVLKPGAFLCKICPVVCDATMRDPSCTSCVLCLSERSCLSSARY